MGVSRRPPRLVAYEPPLEGCPSGPGERARVSPLSRRSVPHRTHAARARACAPRPSAGPYTRARARPGAPPRSERQPRSSAVGRRGAVVLGQNRTRGSETSAEWSSRRFNCRALVKLVSSSARTNIERRIPQTPHGLLAVARPGTRQRHGHRRPVLAAADVSASRRGRPNRHNSRHTSRAVRPTSAGPWPPLIRVAQRPCPSSANTAHRSPRTPPTVTG